MERGTDVRRAAADDLDDGRIVTSQDDRNARLDDTRLLRGDFLHRIAEPVAMVEPDSRDDTERRITDVGRIETSAEPALENRVINLRLRVELESDGGQGLEECWFGDQGSGIRDQNARNPFRQSFERFVIDWCAIEKESFVDLNQMR